MQDGRSRAGSVRARSASSDGKARDALNRDVAVSHRNNSHSLQSVPQIP